MRILIAGASGAIGRALVRRLRANQHEVFALTRSPDSAPALEEIGAKPVIADALNAAAVKATVGRIRPDAVINELTSLPRHYTPAEMKVAAERDRKVRVEGNMNLLAALRDAGVRRYLLQSSGFWYAPGAGLADESVPFISSASPGVEASARTYLELEARASATPGTEFVALRYGFFYGPGTWYTREGDIGDQVRQRQVPIIGEGQGVYSFVHIDDAAALARAPVERAGRHATAVIYGYWSGLAADGYRWLYRPGASAGFIPTNAGETCVFAAMPSARYASEASRGLDRLYRTVVAEAAPELAAALSRAQPRGKLWPFPGTPGIMRRPWGEGWALVGDAGSFRDPLTAHGLTDALRDAELLARAVVAGGPGALAGYQAIRDRAATTFFDLSDRVASFEWDLEELKVLHKALAAEMAAETDLVRGLGAEGAGRAA